MTDRMVLRLSANWAVLADDRQWMLCRRRRNRWDAISFVATTKAILFRCIRDKDAVVDAGGQAALDALPETFRKWKRQAAESPRSTTGGEFETGRHSRNSVSDGVKVPDNRVATPAHLKSPLITCPGTRDGEAAR